MYRAAKKASSSFSNQAQRLRARERLATRRRAELALRRPDMCVQRVERHEKGGRDLCLRLVAVQALQHIALSLGQQFSRRFHRRVVAVPGAELVEPVPELSLIH